MSGKQAKSSTVAGPTTRGRVFAVVSRRDPTWVTAMVLVEPGPAVYVRRGGAWHLDETLGRRIGRGGVQLRELVDRSKVSAEVSRWDRSESDGGASVTRARVPAPTTKTEAATVTPLTPWQVRATARAKREAEPRRGRALVGGDGPVGRQRGRGAILAAGGLTASAMPAKPRTSTPESLRRDRAVLARRREARAARVVRRRQGARSEALVASAVRRGMRVSGMVSGV